MKISKTSWALLAFGLIIIAGASLFILFKNEDSRKTDLEDRLALAAASIPAVVANIATTTEQADQLSAQLEEVLGKLAQAKGQFPETIQSIEYASALVQMAANSGVDLLSFESSEASKLTLSKLNFEMTEFTLVVRGDINPMLSFISAIDKGADFLTGSMDVIKLTFDTITAEDDLPKPTATITLLLISYEG
ncbi:MAG: hypothetical protein LLF82_001215 [Dehalococcoides mccartyi]|jgi:hypothetical protein|uniref:Pilus assembly protein PilO n=2 Tax=root TaxID=1 RepID=A0AB33HR39_9CHLR|nr:MULTISPECIES: hypothetical protein [Dehalococcoides]MCF7635721.1 hypothetical protein [Dehalococcoides mccartyi]MEA2121375.1 hypothetical protein [Dehalococcoides mccartyi]MEA2122993.1 hypothetical protein [Dehalococcoides mccartyi]MEA4879148.1 hypothetical protein [Dehalococcoides mccartyi]POZ59770.1 hypothetical protein C1O63_0313 [Dehalococcoides mccartyi]